MNEPSFQDLGHLGAGLTVSKSGNIELVYSNGDSCTNHNGNKDLTKTIITFVCDETYKVSAKEEITSGRENKRERQRDREKERETERERSVMRVLPNCFCRTTPPWYSLMDVITILCGTVT